MPDNLPKIPAPITPADLLAWCQALGVQRGDAAYIMGRDKNLWARLEAGEGDIKLSQLNTLLNALAVRRAALIAEA